jgi:hypothetical protein
MDNCPLFYMNTEVKNAAAREGLTNFDYWLGNGDHKVDDPGETKVFEEAVQFICNRFDHPVPRNNSWSHYDLYPEFGLWGYTVKSDKKEPGFLYLRHVTPSGFGLYSRKWLPDGPAITGCKATVTTAPLYQKGAAYGITIYRQGVSVSLKQKADAEGRLHFDLTGDGCEVAIAHQSLPADFVLSGYRLDQDRKYLRVNEKNELTMTLLNRGGSAAYTGRKMQLAVTCMDSAVVLSPAVQEIQPDRDGKIRSVQPVHIICRKTPPGDASPPWLKLDVEIRCGDAVFRDALTVPVFYEAPCFSHIRMDDGVAVRDKAIGAGNGNGQAEDSERIMLYENYQRLRLYTDDPYVESASETVYDEVLGGAIWPDGFTLSSVVKIADDCPPGHTIEFLASYETKTFMPIRREVHWGRVKLTTGKTNNDYPQSYSYRFVAIE